MNIYKTCILKEKQQRYLSTLSTGKIDKYEYLAGEEVLPSDQIRMIGKANLLFFYRKDFWKTNKNNGRLMTKAKSVFEQHKNN